MRYDASCGVQTGVSYEVAYNSIKKGRRLFFRCFNQSYFEHYPSNMLDIAIE